MKIENVAQLSNLQDLISNVFFSTEFRLIPVRNGLLLEITPLDFCFYNFHLEQLREFGFELRSVYYDDVKKKLVVLLFMAC